MAQQSSDRRQWRPEEHVAVQFRISRVVSTFVLVLLCFNFMLRLELCRFFLAYYFRKLRIRANPVAAEVDTPRSQRYAALVQPLLERAEASPERNRVRPARLIPALPKQGRQRPSVVGRMDNSEPEIARLLCFARLRLQRILHRSFERVIAQRCVYERISSSFPQENLRREGSRIDAAPGAKVMRSDKP